MREQPASEPPSPPAQPVGALPGGGVDLDVRYAPRQRAGERLQSLRAMLVGADTSARGSSHSARGPAGRIPKLIHQTWKDTNPPRKLFSPRWRASLKAQNKGWKYRLWTDSENRELVATRYPWFLKTYDAYPSPIQRADAARYMIAHAHGGLYADLDTECFSPFSPLLTEGTSLLLTYKAGGNFSRGACNSIFASSRAHPFWRVVFDVLLNRSATPLRSHKDVLYSTGPAVLREAIRRTLRLAAADTIRSENLDELHASLGIRVLHANVLHPVTADRRTEDDVAGRPASAVCTHHFVSSWVKHDKALHENVDRLRRAGDATAAVDGKGQPVMTENEW